MGSSTSKRRAKRKHPQHLPKVGTKPNREWELHEKQRVDFGSMPIVIVVVLVLVLAIGVLAIT